MQERIRKRINDLATSFIITFTVLGIAVSLIAAMVAAIVAIAKLPFWAIWTIMGCAGFAIAWSVIHEMGKEKPPL